MYFCFAAMVISHNYKTRHNRLDNSNLLQWRLILLDYSSDSLTDFKYRKTFYKSFNKTDIKNRY